MVEEGEVVLGEGGGVVEEMMYSKRDDVLKCRVRLAGSFLSRRNVLFEGIKSTVD